MMGCPWHRAPWGHPLKLPCPGQSPQAVPVLQQLMWCPSMCFVQGTGEAYIPLRLHPPFPPSFYPSVLPSLLLSLCPSIPLAIPPSLHPTSSCSAPRLPTLSLLLSPSLMQEQVLPAPSATGSTPPGEWGWLFCCHLYQRPLSSTSPRSPWLAGSISPFSPGRYPPLAPSALG